MFDGIHKFVINDIVYIFMVINNKYYITVYLMFIFRSCYLNKYKRGLLDINHPEYFLFMYSYNNV
jgi:hypothetical protein